jgi:UDP-N-acetylmuramate--alanine ligase
MFENSQNIHFVGIGGAGMSAIAEVLINSGRKISGSDLKKTSITEYLETMGAKIYIGHNAENIKLAELVVASAAVGKDNPEIIAALKRKIPVISRIEMLAELARLKYAVTIAGTHGKTTTTSLTSLILNEGGLDPTVVIGGKLKNFQTSAKLGRGNYIVAEADESDGSFLKLSPVIAIVTNIDNDHLDYYGSMENLKEAFVKHINSIPFYGVAIVCSDSEIVREIIPKIRKKYITYGIAGNPDIKVSDMRLLKDATSFDVICKGRNAGSVCLRVPGKHNVCNSLAAVGAGMWLGIPFNLIAEAVGKFEGVGRRLEIKGEKSGIMVVDDYAHHPTEIAATLNTVKNLWPGRRLVVLFQPHRYTRTKQLFSEFGASFSDADFTEILDIYSAGEQSIDGVNSDLILKSLVSNGYKAGKFSNLEEFSQNLRVGDIVLTLGAGDVWEKGEELLTLI